MKSFSIKKIIKWFLIILLALFVIAGAGLTYFYTTAFKLVPWEYKSKEVSGNNLPERPNILFLVAEDMSSRVGAFGDSLAQTPNIDKLASQGIRYTNVFTTAGVCAPSRAGLITGMNQISMGGQHMRTGGRPEGGYYCVPPPDMKAYPELLRAAGYYTFNIAKEDYQFSGMLPGSGPFTIWDDENNNNLWRGRKGGQPFFGMINFMETHESGLFRPLGNKPHSFLHFIMQIVRPAMLMSRGINYEAKTVDPHKIKLPPYYPDTKAVREDIAKFYNNINVMDAVVGNIIERLEKDGLAESTIVIWTTDHGDCLPRAKRDLTLSGLKVPMVIYWPEAYRPKNIKPGTADFRLTSFIDLAPTFLDIAKAPKPKYLQGFSLLSDSSNQYVYASKDRIDEISYRQRAIIDSNFSYIKSWYPDVPDGAHIKFRDNIEMMRDMWKLKDENKLDKNQMLWFEPTGKERLYDLQKDPLELHNLVNDTTYTNELNRMRIALSDWLNRIDDWSDIPENEMVEGFLDNGKQKITPLPEITVSGNELSISCEEKGASIGYQINDGPWQLYINPLYLIGNEKITAKAVRYGWKESKEVNFTNN